jgi:signal transduction histidine kinase
MTFGTSATRGAAATMTRMRPERWLELAGFLTWVVSGVPTLLAIRAGELRGPAAALWGAAFVAFGLAFAVMCSDRGASWKTRPRRLLLLTVQSTSALIMVGIGFDALPAATLVVVAGQLRWVFASRAAAAWVAAQSVALFVIGLRYVDLPESLGIAGAFAGFQVFALATAALAFSERQAREALARANAELQATHALMAENSRVAERLRISRDLHDALGHHLTALSLQLDVASRLADGKAAAHVLQAHAITRLLLGDVRDVVSRMRESSGVDLGQALRTLVDAPGTLQIHLDVPDGFGIDDPAQAHALLRCVQEIITNAARHAHARNLWIRIESTAEGVALHARDDGRGAAELTPGNGLTGMRERFQEFAGRVDFTAAAGRGFEVHGFLPRPQAAS